MAITEWRGSNPISKMQHEVSADKLQVRDIWHTLQGEGPFSGQQAVFIRLSGCNLRCTFCDTLWDLDKDLLMSINDIVLRARYSTVTPWLVVITGGEPMLQPILSLVEKLLGYFHVVQFETAGTVWRDELRVLAETMPDRLQIVVSPKTPDIAKQYYEFAQSWKYPLRGNRIDWADGLPCINTQITDGRAVRLARPPSRLERSRIFVTPIDEGTGNEHLTALNLRAVARSAQSFGYTAQVQLHKYLGVK